MSSKLPLVVKHSWGLIGQFVGLLWENDSIEQRQLNVAGGGGRVGGLRQKNSSENTLLVDCKIQCQHLLFNLDTRAVVIPVTALVIFYYSWLTAAS